MRKNVISRCGISCPDRIVAQPATDEGGRRWMMSKRLGSLDRVADGRSCCMTRLEPDTETVH